MKNDKWAARIQRATELTSVYPFAAEGLRFYAGVAALQCSLYAEMQRFLGNSLRIPSMRPLRDELELSQLLSRFPGFLSALRKIGPKPLAQGAAGLSGKGITGWQRAIEDFWQGGLDAPAEVSGVEEGPAGGFDDGTPAERLLAWIFLQPYAEYLADRREPPRPDGTPFTCPLCGANPIVGVLRGLGDGAKKSLICMLCAHEWDFRRIYCPACGEEREPQMAFYSAPEIAHVRVDVCDTCHTYLKSVDLTKTGLAVPIVDELATMPLDLWAREHGYKKLQTNVLGI
jgi:formate dehydrogenase maturation protein FdhE